MLSSTATVLSSKICCLVCWGAVENFVAGVVDVYGGRELPIEKSVF